MIFNRNVGTRLTYVHIGPCVNLLCVADGSWLKQTTITGIHLLQETTVGEMFSRTYSLISILSYISHHESYTIWLTVIKSILSNHVAQFGTPIGPECQTFHLCDIAGCLTLYYNNCPEGVPMFWTITFLTGYHRLKFFENQAMDSLFGHFSEYIS